MEKLPGHSHECRSFDSVKTDAHFYPTEYLNSLSPSGMPPHKMGLKVGCPVMLLRILDPQHGHCNGTKYNYNDHGKLTSKPILWGGIPDGDSEFRNSVGYKWASVSTLSNDLYSLEWPGNLSITKSLITLTVLFVGQIMLLPTIHWRSWQFYESSSKFQPIKSSRDHLNRKPAGKATRNGPCGESHRSLKSANKSSWGLERTLYECNKF